MSDRAGQLLAVAACLQTRGAKVQLQMVQKVGVALHECPIVEGSNHPSKNTNHVHDHCSPLSLSPDFRFSFAFS